MMKSFAFKQKIIAMLCAALLMAAPVSAVLAESTPSEPSAAPQQSVFNDATVSITNASTDAAVDGKISGKATFTGTEPLVAKLYAQADLNSAMAENVINASGDSYSFSGLAAGSYVVKFFFWGEGNQEPRFSLTASVGYNAPSVINALQSANTKARNESASGAADGEIYGSAVFTGTKRLFVKLYAQADLNTAINEAVVGASGGSYSFTGLAGGSYVVRFFFEGEGSLPPLREESVTVGTDVPVSAITASAVIVNQNTIKVTISAADALPITINLLQGGSVTASANVTGGGSSASFTDLADGTYTVGVNYNPAQAGVSAVEIADLVINTQPAAISITSVTAGENQLTIKGTAQPDMEITVTTNPSSTPSVVRSGADGSFTATIVAPANTYTQVYAKYSSDASSLVTSSGSWVVAAPATKPTLTVDPVDVYSTTVIAKTTPGVTVTLKTHDYTQTVTADASGLLYFTLPHTYLKGDTITFTVYYGTDKSFDQKAAVSAAANYSELKKNSQGDAVYKLTSRLAALGYPVSPTTTYTDSVAAAVRLFQQANGLSVDGVAGSNTQAVLYSVSAIAYGEINRYPTFVRGDRNHPLIYAMQQRLKDLGYYTIKVDGIFGSGTQRAVRDFQRINGLTVTGKADNTTQVLLYSSAAKPAGYGESGSYETLKRSSRYQSKVIPLQRRLKELGYYAGSIDGYFGSQTYRAVRNFQRINGISVTGIADPYTQQVLHSSTAQAYNGSSAGTSSGYRLLYWGCTGSAVTQLQNALIDAGYKSIVRTADGIFGRWTYDAVRAYQKDHGLAVDGIAGKNTQNSLYGTNY